MSTINNSEADDRPASDEDARKFLEEKIIEAKKIARNRFRDVIMVLRSGYARSKDGRSRDGYKTLIGGQRVERDSGWNLHDFARANFGAGVLLPMGRNLFIVMEAK